MSLAIEFQCGDSTELLRKIDSASVNCCVTSPPYFGLRDYGHDSQIGFKDTPEEYIVKLVDVFREVWRVLRDDGTLWLNLGDTYSAGGRGDQGAFQKSNQGSMNRLGSFKIHNVKPKNLLGIPWRIALELQAEGWYLRQDIIWHKPNPMPESVQDRCTRAHEYIFLLSKSSKYYYDHEAIKEPCVSTDNTIRNRNNTRLNNTPGRIRMGGLTTNHYTKRNKRSVWTVTNKPYTGAHFAVFPEKLIEPCILAGCPVNGLVLDPFGGSGTTGIVALNKNRRAILCDINPKYIAIAKKRTLPRVNTLTEENNTMSIYHDAVNNSPQLKRGKISCLSCGRSQNVNLDECLQTGWPKCCDYTMTTDSPKKQTQLALE